MKTSSNPEPIYQIGGSQAQLITSNQPSNTTGASGSGRGNPTSSHRLRGRHDSTLREIQGEIESLRESFLSSSHQDQDQDQDRDRDQDQDRDRRGGREAESDAMRSMENSKSVVMALKAPNEGVSVRIRLRARSSVTQADVEL